MVVQLGVPGGEYSKFWWLVSLSRLQALNTDTRHVSDQQNISRVGREDFLLNFMIIMLMIKWSNTKYLIKNIQCQCSVIDVVVVKSNNCLMFKDFQDIQIILNKVIMGK